MICGKIRHKIAIKAKDLYLLPVAKLSGILW